MSFPSANISHRPPPVAGNNRRTEIFSAAPPGFKFVNVSWSQRASSLSVPSQILPDESRVMT